MARQARRMDRRFHESTSRAICRLAFLLLGGMPLLGCILWCALQFLPSFRSWQTQRWEKAIGQALGLLVEIESVESLTPNRTGFHELLFSHPETGTVLGSAEGVQLEWYGGQCLINVSRPVIEGLRLQAAWEHLHNSVLCRPYRNLMQTTLEADELTVRAADDAGSLLLSKIRTRVIPRDQATWLDMSFLVEQSDTPARADREPARVVLRRFHEESRLTTEARVNSGELPLPCSLIRWLVPEASSFGPDATFVGTILIDRSRDGWVAQVQKSAVLRNVDFASLSWLLPDSLAGLGHIEFQEKAVFGTDGIDFLEAAVSLGSGSISWQALNKLQSYLGVSLASGVAESKLHNISFEQAYLKFQLSPSGLRLIGFEPKGGTMLCDSARQVLAWRPNESWQESIPLAKLVTALQRSHSSDTGDAVALGGKSANRLIQWLPLSREQATAKTAQRGLRLSTAH